MFLVVSIAILDVHSSVNVAECGLNKTLLFFNKGLSKFIGSFTNTSNAAPKIRFSFNALSRSISLMIPPLAVFTIKPFFYMSFKIE